MGIRVALHHKTSYLYDRPVTLSPQTVRLRPAPHNRTPVSAFSLRVEPREHFINWQQDAHGNFLARLVFPEPTERLSFEVDLIADMVVLNPFDFFLEPYAEKFPFGYEAQEKAGLAPYLAAEPTGPRLAAFLDSVDRAECHTIEFLVKLNRQLQQEIRYEIRMEPGVQSPEETLELRCGSCRDTGWLAVQTLRHLGLAARFVSGYLIQLKPDEKALEGPAGAAEDFTDLHAWAEVYLPGAGWVGLDPTSGLLAGEGHIPLAATSDPAAAAPVSGMVSPCEVEFRHEMRVTRILEEPRVTKPYSDEEWERILRLGDRIDQQIVAHDIRLTMGGEPTFIGIDDMDAPEWNTEAQGEDKQRLAGDLVRRLRKHFAPGGFLHFGQGKWYPGESLPRWAFTCYWRTDGQPLWHDPQWLAEPARDYGYGQKEAEAFAATLARRFGVDEDYLVSAYEDPLAYIHKERQLPINVDPVDNKLDDAEERERLRRVYERGVGNPVGYVLPIQRVFGMYGGKYGPAWQSGLWMLRARHLFLLPGDSPVGFRLPLQSLPWEPVEMRQQVWYVDPSAARAPLQVPQRAIPAEPMQLQSVRQRSPSQASQMQFSGQPVVRTALVVEPRHGALHVFLPPVASTEDYAELLTAVEDTATALRMPVLIEGYPPPKDARLREIKVTPDPGVIEVNLHPAASWRELVHNTTTLYEQARQSRLGTEKFMLDGRHSGTGGGNHIVLGGATTADSPFLRRPDVLKSMVGYWLNHPSLSYLFSGVFIGPTSQHPRVDEARTDAVYELEIAFNTLDRAIRETTSTWGCPPWLVDRIFRNLLVDVTGNTHRTEFCIDKLYSPDSATGRLGLVELRSFEMPPNSRMSLAQQLLVRALLVWMWHKPYRARLTHWGTRLHDRFLLPHFAENDFRGVIDDLNQGGFAFDAAWFAPHLEFRFPLIGRVHYEGVKIELRQAIEPWHVLGEEPGTGGTTRFVDSSLERLQVKVSGLEDGRYILACNGRRLPLHETTTAGEFVCGVRYRAWQPPRCLHPTIPVHTPLTIDLIDTHAGRSVGGCTYYVGHPGGRNYETFPVNSNEAEARRRARFSPFGHTPGRVVEPKLEVNSKFPVTLDLRVEQV